MKCAKCHQTAHGWKCSLCGRESDEFEPQHVHGDPPANRYNSPKCDGCSLADVHCTCG